MVACAYPFGMDLPIEGLIASDGLVGLRHFSAADVEAITSACNDPAITRWTSIPSPYTIEFAQLFVTLTETWRHDGTAFHFAVVDARDGSFLGSVGLDSVEHPPALVGYWVAPWARRRGVATGALRLMTTWAFETLPLGSIDLLTKVGNELSERVAVGAGYTFCEEAAHPSDVVQSSRTVVRRWTRTRMDTSNGTVNV